MFRPAPWLGISILWSGTRAQADLLVGLNNDASVHQIKGREGCDIPPTTRPESLEAVGYVTEFDHPRAENIIPTVRRDFLVKG